MSSDEDLTKDVCADSPFEQASLTPIKARLERSPSDKTATPSSKAKFTFKCPEDGVECRFADLGKLPKNFAMLKVLHKHTESKIKTVQAEFSHDNQDFVVTETPSHSLTKFLADD